uniref:Uncharacterized protein n=1 Tax=Janibacter limosus TaxID=53458 RepID=A0AC61U3F3_9MICO|nr:hypothetical protein [Janibacter limosus]
MELTLPGGVRATLLAYVARFPHLYLKDAFVMGERLDQVQERYTQIPAVEGYDFADAVRTLDPAQTRVPGARSRRHPSRRGQEAGGRRPVADAAALRRVRAVAAARGRRRV